MTKTTDFGALRSKVASADRSVVESALSRAIMSTPPAWLGDSHPLLQSADRRALKRKPTDGPYSGAEVRSIAEYCAASVYLHASDAITYLGRGLSAYISGTPSVAVHLMYYSELRSVHSLLARDGIVVFNGNPVCLTSDSSAERVAPLLANTGTHRATWDIFSVWAAEHSGERLKETIRVGGRSLGEWTSAWRGAGSADAILKQLIVSWGLDLNHLGGDRDVRNTASYEPSRLAPAALSADRLGPAWLVEETWSLLEPSGSSSFEKFDIHVLRDVLAALGNASTGSEHSASILDTSRIESLLDELGLLASHNSLVKALSGPQKMRLLDKTSELPIQDVEPDDQIVAAVASRAVALLRFALGSVATLTDRSGVDPDALEFWARDLLLMRGLDAEADSSALWDEITFALEDVGALGVQMSAPSLGKIDDWAKVAQTLATTERVVRWVQAV